MIAIKDRISGEVYYGDNGTPYDPSKYEEISIEEKKPPSENNALVVSSTGTVKSPELPSWLSNALGPIQGALDVGKEMVGPGVGGVAGSAIGGAAAGLMGPEAIPAGMYLGGIIGGGSGKLASDYLRFGQTNLPEAGKVMATDAILGPVGAGVSAATKGVLRELPIVGRLMGNLTDKAMATGENISVGKLAGEAAHQSLRPKNYDPASRKATEDTLQNITDDLYRLTGGSANNWETNPYVADTIRQRIGKLQEIVSSDRSGIANPLYRSLMEDLRSQATVGGNNAARYLLQAINENSAKQAVSQGLSKAPLIGGAGLGLSAYFGSRMLNDPMSALTALGLAGIPAGYQLGKGLAKAGYNSFNPYAYGIGGVMEGLTGQ